MTIPSSIFVSAGNRLHPPANAHANANPKLTVIRLIDVVATCM
jgi:hypothetical protein